MTLLLLFHGIGGGGGPIGSVQATYMVRVDWDGDGVLSTASNEDITAYVRSIETRTGRDQPGRLRGRCQPGRAVIQLWNTDGIFSRFNATGPLFGKILPRRRVQINELTPFPVPIWSGYLTDVRPSAHLDGRPTAVLTAEGPLALIAAANVNTGVSTGARTDVHVGTVLDAINWSTAERSIATGSVDTSTWYASGETALAALRKLEDTELGLIGELTSAFGIFYEGRQYRTTQTRSTVAQSTFSDTASGVLTYQAIDQLDELDEIANRITVQTPDTITAGSSGTLWSLGTDVGTVEQTQIAPNAGFAWTAQYSGDGVVSAWDTPTIGSTTNDDVYLVTSTGGAESFGTTGVVTDVVKNATSMYFIVRNQETTGSLDICVKRVRARGTPATGAAGAAYVAQDTATSQAIYGVRDYELEGGYYPNASAAQTAIDLLLARQKDPRAKVAVEILANKSAGHLLAASTRRVSDRVAVVANSSRTALGINTDFWVESISHRIDQNGGRHVVRYELGECTTA